MDRDLSTPMKFQKGDIETFFSHPVWKEIVRRLTVDMLAQRGDLEKSNPSDPEGAAKILRAQGRLESAERFCRFPMEIVLYCVAKDDQELLDTIRRLEQCRTNRLPQPQTPEPEQP